MNKQTTFDPAGPAPLPWHEPRHSQNDAGFAVDPRPSLSADSLDDASRTAFPIVASQKARRDGLGLFAGIGVALMLGLVTFMSMSAERESPPAEVSAAPTTPVAPSLAHVAPETTQPGILAEGRVGAELAETALAPVQTELGAPPLHAPTMSPVVVFDGTAAASAAATPNSGHAGHEGGSGSELLSGSKGSSGEGSGNQARSTRMANPATTVVQGTLISAVLETGINSDVPGFARAVVSQDVRSFDGTRILIPRSSRLIGEYKTMPSAGQRRVHLIWTRLVRPDGVSIELASPATDVTGQAGVGGKVNTHFFERLGSALLTSVIGSVSPFARGGATVVVAGGESAASVAAQGLGQRPPTIKVRQGEPVKVFAARDLVFTPTDGAAE